MDRPFGLTDERPLKRRLGPRERRVLRAVCVAVGLVAIALLWGVAIGARWSLLREGDRRAAAIAAGYLEVLTSSARPAPASAEARLLSAAGTLSEASFWVGGLQVWLDGVPLLAADSATGPVAHALVSYGSGAGQAIVGVWEAIPPASLPSFQSVSAGLASAALLTIAAAGEFMRRRRSRATVAFLGLLVVGWGAFEQGRTVWVVDRIATESTLLRARRVIESAAVGRRLAPEEVKSLAGGFEFRVIDDEGLVRPKGVERDTTEVRATVVAARGQAWILSWPDDRIGAELWRTLWALATLVVAMAFVSAALAPSAGYLTVSSSDS